ncbi:solute carrier family 22 member 13-like isoform X2 [Xiphophorus couchianus]|uniref:solute carrier family 22 member 13-like isoform X2 n=1 Tax=Xiphophorus couchianus TaxID=32473 RepID=UPI001015EC3E|nr:solute carrier family 22 member 13-like isoform X2 [Xiphophorus couchianus]
MADFGEILRNIGEFGLFQQLTLTALAFPNFCQGFLMSSFLFIQSDPERHCNTDWILRAANLTTEEQLNLTVPREEDGSFSRCRMFVPVDWDIQDIREFGLNETTGCRDGWVYGSMLYESTIVTDFDLVCGRSNMVGVIQTVFLAGILLGSLMFGPFAESFGRKRATQIPAVISFVFTLTTALCPSIYLYLASIFMMGIGAGGYRVNCIILATEWIGVSKRSWGACVTQFFGSVGQCVLAGTVYGIRKWRVAQLISAAPLAVVAVYIWFIPESARWLLNKGRTEEVKQLIAKAAAVNKQPVPHSLLEKVTVNTTPNNGGMKIIFRSPLLTRYFLTVVLAWFSLNLCIYCLYLDMGNLGFSIFLTQFLFGAFEIPAVLFSMWLLEIFGRKALFIFTLVIGGLSSLLIVAVPQEHALAVTSLAVAARFFLVWAGSVALNSWM